MLRARHIELRGAAGITESLLTTTQRPYVPLSWVVLALLALLLPATLVASPQEPAQPAESHQLVESAPAEQAAAEAGASAEAALEEDDEEWLIDEDGKRYRLERIPKSGGLYIELPNGKIRSPWGIHVDIVDEDEEWYYLRAYDTTGIEIARRPWREEPTPEEQAEAAKNYVFELETVDRLRFEPCQDGLPQSGQWRQGFQLADLNGDGLLDLAHGSPRKQPRPPVLILQEEGCHWRLWSEAKFPDLQYDYGDIGVGDFNADGNADLVLGIHFRGVRAMLGDGKGGFTTWNRGLSFERPGNGGFSSRALDVADWNGDGRDDVIVLGEGPLMGVTLQGGDLPASNGVLIYLSTEQGWEAHSMDDEDDLVFGDHVVLGDFDGNDRVDFAISSSKQSYDGLVYLSAADRLWDRRQLQLRPDSYVNSVAAADFDGNGRDDLVVGYSSHDAGQWRTGIDLYLWKKEGGFERRTLWNEVSVRHVWSLGAGDIDGDGKADLVGLTGDGVVMLFLGGGDGTLVQEEEALTAPQSGCRGYHLELADLDGDGRDEIFAAFAGEGATLVSTDTIPGCRAGGAIRVWSPRPKAEHSHANNS